MKNNECDIMEKVETSVVKRALNGEEKAFAEILDRYKGPIYGLILRMVRNKEEAEDLVQEAFIKAFNALPSFNEEYAFSTWLYKIAVNNCIDYFRKKRLATFPLDKPIMSKNGEIKREFSDTGSTPEHRMLSSERTTMIDQAIDTLPEKYRIVIILRHKEDRAYEEIAEILEIPLGTVKARIFRAREMLKRKLKHVIRA